MTLVCPLSSSAPPATPPCPVKHGISLKILLVTFPLPTSHISSSVSCWAPSCSSQNLLFHQSHPRNLLAWPPGSVEPSAAWPPTLEPYHRTTTTSITAPVFCCHGYEKTVFIKKPQRKPVTLTNSHEKMLIRGCVPCSRTQAEPTMTFIIIIDWSNIQNLTFPCPTKLL